MLGEKLGEPVGRFANRGARHPRGGLFDDLARRVIGLLQDLVLQIAERGVEQLRRERPVARLGALGGEHEEAVDVTIDIVTERLHLGLGAERDAVRARRVHRPQPGDQPVGAILHPFERPVARLGQEGRHHRLPRIVGEGRQAIDHGADGRGLVEDEDLVDAGLAEGRGAAGIHNGDRAVRCEGDALQVHQHHFAGHWFPPGTPDLSGAPPFR